MPAPSEFTKVISEQMQKSALAKIRLPAGRPLPAAVVTDLDKKAKSIADRIWDTELSKEGLREARTAFQAVNVPAAVTARMKDALSGLKSVSQSADLQNILAENAKMLKAKYDALVAAGFPAAEAFELLKVELAARKSK